VVIAIDKNILLDLFLPDPLYGRSSLQLLEKAYVKGDLVICNLVYAELAPQFNNKSKLDGILYDMSIEVSPVNNESSYIAGRLWR
jgi:predicted nucleic acid-binding protein